MGGADRKTLAGILEPRLPADFLRDTYGRDFLHVRGRRGRFSHLLPWPVLNEILARHRLNAPRLRLMCDGARVPVSAYTRHAAPQGQRAAVPRLRAERLNEQLRAGATLVLDAVDELHAPLEELAEGLELTFRERVQINMYAGWRTSHGFDLHWDDHDVFILQVAGRKRWRIYGQTRPHPLSRQDPEPTPKPTGDALWEDTLEDGDLLYIPRGWWHVAFPLDEPTLHLTVGIHARTGVDLLRWLADGLRASELYRRDLPRLSSPQEQAAHAAALREELLACFDDAALARYLADCDANAEPRPRAGLPLAATPEVSSPPPETFVRLTAPRPLAFDVSDGSIEFACNRKLWKFDGRAHAVLQQLAERRVCRVSELCEGARGVLDSETVRAFVGELIRHGLLAVVEAGAAGAGAAGGGGAGTAESRGAR